MSYTSDLKSWATPADLYERYGQEFVDNLCIRRNYDESLGQYVGDVDPQSMLRVLNLALSDAKDMLISKMSVVFKFSSELDLYYFPAVKQWHIKLTIETLKVGGDCYACSCISDLETFLKSNKICTTEGLCLGKKTSFISVSKATFPCECKSTCCCSSGPSYSSSNSSGGGTGPIIGDTAWGKIKGNIADQTDLNAVLSNKVNIDDLNTVVSQSAANTLDSANSYTDSQLGYYTDTAQLNSLLNEKLDINGISPGDNITITGNGTEENPYVINSSASGGGGGSGDVSNGGNNVSADMSIGTKTDFGLNLKTNDLTRLQITKDGLFAIGKTPDGDAVFDIYESGNGDAPRTVTRSVLNLEDPVDGSSAQMAIYAANIARHNTGVYALLRNYFASEMTGDGEVTELYGVRGITRIYDQNQGAGQISSGLVQNAYGVEAYANNTSSNGVIRNATGLVVSSAKATGADAGQNHIARGIWIQDGVQASGGDNNQSFAIDSQSTAQSRFYGELLLENGKSLLFKGDNSGKISFKAPNGLTEDSEYTWPAQLPDSGVKVFTVGSDGVIILSDMPSPGVAIGGNTVESQLDVGTLNNHSLGLVTNGTQRVKIMGSGEFMVGANTPSDLAGNPNVAAFYKFDTQNTNRSFVVYDLYHSFYGDSNESRNGTVFNLSLRPGEVDFIYGGEYASLVSNAYISTAGRVNTVTGLKNQVSCVNGQGTIQDATAGSFSVSAPAGVINNAFGIKVPSVEAKGASPNNHLAVGIDIANDGLGISSIDSSGSNIAIGLRIGNNITGTTQALAIQSNSLAKSEFQGPMDMYKGIRLATTGVLPAASESLRGTQWLVQGGPGVADTLHICIKNAADAYEWMQL